MKPVKRPRVKVMVSHLINDGSTPRRPNQMTLEEARRYTSPKPLRGYVPRPKQNGEA
jgi:hypothetical protein